MAKANKSAEREVARKMAGTPKGGRVEVKAQKDDRDARATVAVPKGFGAKKKLQNGLRPAGFLVIPTDDNPTPTAFAGILVAMGSRESKNFEGKTDVWGVFRATEDQLDAHVFDKATGETFPVTAGMLVGVSRKGGLSAMNEELIDSFFVIEYTGRKVQMGSGKNPMWEILCDVYEGA